MSKKKSGKSPSVMSFLAKLQSPREAAEGKTPARGLLGDISREDLVAAGRLEEDRPDVTETEPVAAELVRQVAKGDFDERYEDLVDADAGAAGAPTGELTRSARPHNRRSDRRSWSARVAIRGVFSADGLDGPLRGAPGERAGDRPRAVNLSLNGVFVETTSLLDVGDPVVLELPGPDGHPLSIPGRVRWVTPFGGLRDARPGMGVEFVGVDPHKQRLLEELLRRLPGRGEARRP